MQEKYSKLFLDFSEIVCWYWRLGCSEFGSFDFKLDFQGVGIFLKSNSLSEVQDNSV